MIAQTPSRSPASPPLSRSTCTDFGSMFLFDSTPRLCIRVRDRTGQVCIMKGYLIIYWLFHYNLGPRPSTHQFVNLTSCYAVSRRITLCYIVLRGVRYLVSRCAVLWSVTSRVEPQLSTPRGHATRPFVPSTTHPMFVLPHVVLPTPRAPTSYLLSLFLSSIRPRKRNHGLTQDHQKSPRT
ncbi:hypothetical protein B0H12DRAFT_488968 [Mycena haematopus]|nr:hypothetical protein B0H12DRAFT_488968 [Mycena haematopus]